MNEGIERILSAVCDVCDTSRDALLSADRTAPKPMLRAFFWYAIRRGMGYSNKNIANELSMQNGYIYTPAGIGIGITRAIDAISRDKLWKNRWQRLISELDLRMVDDGDNNITVTMFVPRGMSDRVKFDIKERK